jgi:hypothetical protein
MAEPIAVSASPQEELETARTFEAFYEAEGRALIRRPQPDRDSSCRTGVHDETLAVLTRSPGP